jgi:hypothetical protein
MEQLKILFGKIIDYGMVVRSKKLDGLKAWNDIKPLFGESLLNCNGWQIARTINGEIVTDIKQIFDYVHNDLNMKGDDGEDTLDDHLTWEKQHFFLQLIRIIKQNPDFKFVRLAQIAYNIGQLSVYLDSDIVYEGDPKKYYYENNLGRIESYIDLSTCTTEQDNIAELCDVINTKINNIQDQDGGYKNNDPYYAKYIKYKNKYLNLKHKIKQN